MELGGAELAWSWSPLPRAMARREDGVVTLAQLATRERERTQGRGPHAAAEDAGAAPAVAVATPTGSPTACAVSREELRATVARVHLIHE